MMAENLGWSEMNLAFSGTMPPMNCSVETAHPWVYELGKSAESGSYLSPANAIAWVADKVRSAVSGAEVVALMVTGDSATDFTKRIGELADVMPFPSLKQVQRIALSSAQLAVEKMQIPAPLSGGLSGAVPFSVETARTALNAGVMQDAVNAAAAGFDMDELKGALDSFFEKRSQLISEILSGLDELKGKSARVWAFSASGNLATIAVEMLKNIPDASMVHSAVILLTGDNLEPIRGMLSEYQSNAGA
ncbi:hypothetical protein [Type-E symbiont of Plautia stali]|uniref:hypothetical protein n=1 Tax=Type-E symbiont of Plautia stali TaxID=1560357 RepID=UPI00073E592B|nr:hypothetical protein [Type-E symbiont of Plautia stali]